MASEKLFYVGIKGLIVNSEGQYLLLKASARDHSPGTQPYWDIPGGRIEEGASAEETLRREIEEETGVSDISDIKFFTAIISNHQIPLEGEQNAGLVLMVYEAKIPVGSDIKLSPEHTEYEWVSGPVAAERLANKYPEQFTSSFIVN